MELHAKCARCGKYEQVEGMEPARYRFPQLPAGWHYAIVTSDDGSVQARKHVVLCGDCTPVVERAIDAAVAKKT